MTRRTSKTVDSLMKRLQPGKHFIGLWIYRQKNHRKVIPLWTCTLWDKDGDYVETPLRRTPAAALRDVERIVWDEPSGKEGRSKPKRKGRWA